MLWIATPIFSLDSHQCQHQTRATFLFLCKDQLARGFVSLDDAHHYKYLQSKRMASLPRSTHHTNGQAAETVPGACGHSSGAAALLFQDGPEEDVAKHFPMLLQMLHLMDSDNYNLHANSDHQPADQHSMNEDPVYLSESEV